MNGCTMEPDYRQAKPDAKVRADALATTIATWAMVLMEVVPGYLQEAAERRKVEEQAERERAEARRAAEFKAQLEQARQDAQAKLYVKTKEDLIRDYGEFLYELSDRYSYSEDPVRQAQRVRVQGQAGFEVKIETRQTSRGSVVDARPWVKLDNSFCTGFSVGEVRAMLDALQRYRATVPSDEWLPRAETDTPEAQEIQEPEPEQEVPVSMKLSAAVLLGILLPESMDD